MHHLSTFSTHCHCILLSSIRSMPWSSGTFWRFSTYDWQQSFGHCLDALKSCFISLLLPVFGSNATHECVPSWEHSWFPNTPILAFAFFPFRVFPFTIAKVIIFKLFATGQQHGLMAVQIIIGMTKHPEKTPKPSKALLVVILWWSSLLRQGTMAEFLLDFNASSLANIVLKTTLYCNQVPIHVAWAGEYFGCLLDGKVSTSMSSETRRIESR